MIHIIISLILSNIINLIKFSRFSFFFNPDYTIKLTVWHDSYDPQIVIMPIGDEAYTSDSPFTFVLSKTWDDMTQGVWMFMPTEITNKSQNIEGTLVVVEHDIVRISTDYRVATGLAQRTLLDTRLNRYDFTLESGVDYSTTDGNVTVYIYLDGSSTPSATYTIYHNTDGRNDYFTDSEMAINTKYLGIIGFMVLILLSLVVGVLTRTSSAGTHTFFIGSLILSVIATQFLLLGVISTLYYIGIGLRKVMLE